MVLICWCNMWFISKKSNICEIFFLLQIWLWSWKLDQWITTRLKILTGHTGIKVNWGFFQFLCCSNIFLPIGSKFYLKHVRLDKKNFLKSNLGGAVCHNATGEIYCCGTRINFGFRFTASSSNTQQCSFSRRLENLNEKEKIKKKASPS